MEFASCLLEHNDIGLSRASAASKRLLSVRSAWSRLRVSCQAEVDSVTAYGLDGAESTLASG